MDDATSATVKAVPPGRAFVRRWFDDLDDVVLAESRAATTATHPTAIGDRRERAIRDALGKFLPADFRVGKGRVFSLHGGTSEQMDVVVSDSRFPVFQSGDDCLYPVESVAACIEVKSRLTKATLVDAWSKSQSLLKLPLQIDGSDLKRVRRLLEARVGPERAANLLPGLIGPRAYVYAFQGLTRLGQYAEVLADVMREAAHRDEERMIGLPSVIASGGVISMKWMDPCAVLPSGDQRIPPGRRPLFASFQTPHRLGLLASHLLWHLEHRMAYLNHSGSVRRPIADYLPFEEYVNEAVNDAPYKLTLL